MLCSRQSAFRPLLLLATTALCFFYLLRHQFRSTIEEKFTYKYQQGDSGYDDHNEVADFISPDSSVTPTIPASIIADAEAVTTNDAGIPRKIWHKLGAGGLSDEARGWIDGCLRANPGYQHTLLTDDSADDFVTRTFSAERPDIVEAYLGLSVPIFKADLLRYLLLFAEGGVYTDLDVSCDADNSNNGGETGDHGTPSIDEWIPRHTYQDFDDDKKYERQSKEISLVVGYEFDAGWGDDYQFYHQLQTWTILSRPGSRHVWRVVEDIVASIGAERKRHGGCATEDLTLDMVPDVVDFTGPRRFTQSVLTSLAEEQVKGDMVPDTRMWTMLRDKQMMGIREPKLVGDVLIMPGYSFAASMNKYDEEEEGDDSIYHEAGEEIGEVRDEAARREKKKTLGPKLVTHHYAGSWKNDRGGEERISTTEPALA